MGVDVAPLNTSLLISASIVNYILVDKGGNNSAKLVGTILANNVTLDQNGSGLIFVTSPRLTKLGMVYVSSLDFRTTVIVAKHINYATDTIVDLFLQNVNTFYETITNFTNYGFAMSD